MSQEEIALLYNLLLKARNTTTTFKINYTNALVALNDEYGESV